jgi:hypothetical protein
MLKMLNIRLRYCHLMAFFMWLSFKFQLSATSTGHVILALKILVKVKCSLDRPQRPGGRVDV